MSVLIEHIPQSESQIKNVESTEEQYTDILDAKADIRVCLFPNFNAMQSHEEESAGRRYKTAPGEETINHEGQNKHDDRQGVDKNFQ